MIPTQQPFMIPSSDPTSQPAMIPSLQPYYNPSMKPTLQPLMVPTLQPKQLPSSKPSSQPSSRPSLEPSGRPSSYPSFQPLLNPTYQPSIFPSNQPTSMPTTSMPTYFPTGRIENGVWGEIVAGGGSDTLLGASWQSDKKCLAVGYVNGGGMVLDTANRGNNWNRKIFHVLRPLLGVAQYTDTVTYYLTITDGPLGGEVFLILESALKSCSSTPQISCWYISNKLFKKHYRLILIFIICYSGLECSAQLLMSFH